MHISVILCNITVRVVKNESHYLCCLNFVFFAGGWVLGKGPGDELHHHQIQRDDDYSRWLETRLSVCLPDPSPDSCRLRWLQPKI